MFNLNVAMMAANYLLSLCSVYCDCDCDCHCDCPPHSSLLKLVLSCFYLGCFVAFFLYSC